MTRKHFLILSVLVLAGCSSGPQSPPSQGSTTFHPSGEDTAPPQQSHRADPSPSMPVPEQRPLAAADPNDQCGAAELQDLVGKPRTEIPVPLDPSKRRVVCSTCIITQDYRPDRQTITFDTDTGIIKSVKCG